MTIANTENIALKYTLVTDKLKFYIEHLFICTLCNQEGHMLQVPDKMHFYFTLLHITAE